MESSRLMRDSILSTVTSTILGTAPVTAEKLLLTASHLYGAINHREISGKTVCKVWVCCILGSFCCILMFGCVKKLSKNIWHFDVILSTFKGNGSKLPAFLPQSFLMAESPKKSSLMRKGTDRAKSPKKAWWKLPKSAIKDPSFESKTGCMQTLWISDFHLKIWKSENSRKNLFRLAFFLIQQWCRVDTRHCAKALFFECQAGLELAEVPKWFHPRETQTMRMISAHTTNQAQENWVVNRIGELQPQNAQPSRAVERCCFWDDGKDAFLNFRVLDPRCPLGGSSKQGNLGSSERIPYGQ